MEISLVADFDDLTRCTNILTDGTAEIGTNMISKWILVVVRVSSSFLDINLPFISVSRVYKT